MNIENIFLEISKYSNKVQKQDFGDELYFIKGNKREYAPFRFLTKKIPEIKGIRSLEEEGFLANSYDFYLPDDFTVWYESKSKKKILKDVKEKIKILELPNHKNILCGLESIKIGYKILRDEKIIINGKNFPVQLGEWFVKNLFCLEQKKSPSQRGFDFYYDQEQVEVVVHWGNRPAPKGIKVKKSML